MSFTVYFLSVAAPYKLKGVEGMWGQATWTPAMNKGKICACSTSLSATSHWKVLLTTASAE